MNKISVFLKKYRNETIAGVLVFLFFLCKDAIKSILQAF